MESQEVTLVNFRFEKLAFSARGEGTTLRLQAQKRLKCKVSSKKEPPLVLVVFDVTVSSQEDDFRFEAEAVVELRAEALPEGGEPRRAFLRGKCLPCADRVMCEQIKKIFVNMGLPPLDLSDSSFDTKTQDEMDTSQ